MSAEDGRGSHTASRLEIKLYDSRHDSLQPADLPPLDKPRPMHPLIWNVLLASLVLVVASYSILVHLCQEDGHLTFDSASAVLLSEITKLLLSLAMLLPEARGKGVVLPSFKQALPYMVPALLYTFNNNAGIQMLEEMDPSTYQVLCNLKIISTALLYRLIMKRPISYVQWLALCMLAVAGAFNSYGGFQAKAGPDTAGLIHLTTKGLVMICLYCFVSGLSGVYSEYILKDKYEMSIHVQNALLYIFGIILNGGAWFYSVLQQPEGERNINLFRGFTVYTWILVLNTAVTGLLMSAVMKHGNNIIRLFVISGSMVVTVMLSMAVFHLQLNVYICVSVVLVMVALALYHAC